MTELTASMEYTRADEEERSDESRRKATAAGRSGTIWTNVSIVLFLVSLVLFLVAGLITAKALSHVAPEQPNAVEELG